MYGQSRDKNEGDIIRALRQVGAHVQQMDKSAGFDLLVVCRGIVHLIEVKRPKYRHRPAKSYLTDNEIKTRDAIEFAGGAYNIVFSVDDALKVVGVL